MLPFLQLSLCSSEQGCCVIRLISPDLEEKVEIYFRTDGWKTASIIQQFEAQKLPSKRDVKNALQLSSNRNFPSKSHRFHLPTEISRPLHTVLCARQKFVRRNTPILPPNRNFPVETHRFSRPFPENGFWPSSSQRPPGFPAATTRENAGSQKIALGINHFRVMLSW